MKTRTRDANAILMAGILTLVSGLGLALVCRTLPGFAIYAIPLLVASGALLNSSGTIRKDWKTLRREEHLRIALKLIGREIPIARCWPPNEDGTREIQLYISEKDFYTLKFPKSHPSYAAICEAEITSSLVFCLRSNSEIRTGETMEEFLLLRSETKVATNLESPPSGITLSAIGG